MIQLQHYIDNALDNHRYLVLINSEIGNMTNKEQFQDIVFHLEKCLENSRILQQDQHSVIQCLENIIQEFKLITRFKENRIQFYHKLDGIVRSMLAPIPSKQWTQPSRTIFN